jgi:hypothetical protein
MHLEISVWLSNELPRDDPGKPVIRFAAPVAGTTSITGSERLSQTEFPHDMTRQSLLLAICVIDVLISTAVAQSSAKPAAQADTGFTSHAEFGGTSNSDGQIYEINSSAGYNFSQHFGVDVGIPIYFVRASSSLGGTSSNGVGNPYVQARLRFLNPKINFGSALTGFRPGGR